MKHVKLNPYFNHAPHHKSTWGSRGTAPWILNLNTSRQAVSFTLWQMYHQHPLNSRLGGLISLHAMPRIKPQFLHHADCRLVTKPAELNVI